MEPSSREPQQNPEDTPAEQVADTAMQPHAPVIEKKSKKPLVIIVTALVLLVMSSAGALYLLLNQPETSKETSAPQAQNSVEQKAAEPNTVAYAFKSSTDQAVQSELFWRSADGGDKQDAASKANIGRTLVHANQVIVETYGTNDEAPGLLYSDNGGKTYSSLYTGKKSTSATDMGDQITGIAFASDGKSVIFAVLPGEGKNTVRQIAFDKPKIEVDLMTSDARGVFTMGYNVKSNKLYFSEGCYNCDGNGASTSVLVYDTVKKQRSTLVNGADKHLGVTLNKSATRLLVTTPTVDKAKTGGQDEGFWGYYVGPPYALSTLDLETGKDAGMNTTVGTPSDGSYVSTGFLSDGATPYYQSGNKIFSFGKDAPSLLYESGQPIHEVFYVSPVTIFASTGTYQNFTLNRFDVKTQKTKQLLTGDDISTRIFGITER